MISDTALLPAIASIEAKLGPGAATGRGLDLFLRLLLASSDADSLAGVPPEHLAREAMAGFEALGSRPRGQHDVRIRPSHIFASGLVLEIVNDDMPFLLDSVLAEVQARGLDLHLVLHPTFKTERTDAGALHAVTGPGDGRWGDNRQESYIALHIGALGEPRQAELVAAVSSVLDEVRLAVADWKPMLIRLSRAIADLAKAPVAVPRDVLDEHLSFLGWLAEGNFTFLGARDYHLEGGLDGGHLTSRDEGGLGLLADPAAHVLRRGTELVALTPEVRQFFLSSDPVIVTKANVVARVHRRVHMDYIGIKQYAADNSVSGELRLVGLFTSSAYTQSPRQIPVLRRKVQAVQTSLALAPDSHAAKALSNALETFPRDELFQIGPDDLKRWAAGILDLEIRPRVRVFLRYDRFDRFVSALVYIPRDRFSTRVRERIGEFLSDCFGGYIAAFYPYFSEAPLVRVHFIVARRLGTMPRLEVPRIEEGIRRLVRTWNDELAEAVAGQTGAGTQLAERYQNAFPVGYAEVFSPSRALEDIARIERLGAQRPAAIDVHPDDGTAGPRVRVAIYCLDHPIQLSERVPLLENLGFTVIDERTWRLTPRLDGRNRVVVLHDMVLETFDGRNFGGDASLDQRLEETFLAVHRGQAESDGFNRLVMVAGLDWREAALLRAYAAYLRQLRSAFGPRYIAETMVMHPLMVRDLVALFHLHFDPARDLTPEARRLAGQPILAGIETSLAAVNSLDEDRILRQLQALVLATVRTNFYSVLADGTPPETIAFKFDGAQLTMAPAPRPYREIFVASPRVEAVHLRLAPIARGGIRWSDRAQDYRTEVLGLVRAQQVKNAVIVPAGAKGGFFPKAMARNATREQTQAEGLATYKIFVSAMLDLTDNIVDGSVVPPAGMVRHDHDDPYLVVAADKGTATFSDTANGIAQARGFWLGDAFASGGSAGYDHKRLGITARGAWECIKRHFREMDRDIQAEPFRVAGVGDMSGDVFGNGMLLSPAIKLVAAFDHRDIFLDPDPDPATSLAERRRLFEMPRSSWADYDRGRLSPGGGVFSRATKSVPLTPQVRQALGITAEALPPADLMHAILASEVDLLWFGGIGTYVRASGESDADVGDRANDAIRVSAADLRCKVIGEGANLGTTQAGRIEAAGRGIRLNTDFIDNSAGVNTSDQEVNIKIALEPALRSGRLSSAERNRLLAAMAGDVAAAVLRNNYQQSLALSLAERRQARDLGDLGRLIRELEGRGLIDRHREVLPGDHELAERARLGRGLSRPELAVVLAQAKIALLADLLASPVPDDPYLAGLLLDYFPPALRETYCEDIGRHRLRREIVATTLTNGLVNRFGPATPLMLADAAARPIGEVAFAFMAARGTLGLADLWSRIDALDGKLSGAVQLDLYERVRHALVVTASQFLRDGVASQPLQGTIDRHAAGARAIDGAFDRLAPAALAERLATDLANLIGRGVPDDVARAVTRLAVLVQTPAFIDIAMRAHTDPVAAAGAQMAMAEHLRTGEIAARAQEMSPSDDYERLAISGALGSLDVAQRRLAVAYLGAGSEGSDIADWFARSATLGDRARHELEQIAAAKDMSVARLAVAAARLSGLAQAAAPDQNR